MFVNTEKIPEGKWRPPLMDEDWVVLCQALHLSIEEEEGVEMHEKLKEVCTNIGVKKAGQRWLGWVT